MSVCGILIATAPDFSNPCFDAASFAADRLFCYCLHPQFSVIPDSSATLRLSAGDAYCSAIKIGPSTRLLFKDGSYAKEASLAFSELSSHRRFPNIVVSDEAGIGWMDRRYHPEWALRFSIGFSIAAIGSRQASGELPTAPIAGILFEATL